MSQQGVRIWRKSFKAAGIHLLLSLIIAGSLALLLFKIWYPLPLASATGVFTIFALVFVVDLSIGPLLTLLTYKVGKKSLKFDLIVIVLLQVMALMYGIYSLSQARPVWLTFYDNRFELVRLNDIEDSYYEGAEEVYTQPSLIGPQWVAADVQGNEDDIEKLEFGDKLGAKIAHQPNLYYPIERAYPKIKQEARSLEQLQPANTKAQIDKLLAEYPSAVGWLPLWAQQQHMVVLIDDTGAPIGIVNLRPWSQEQLNTVITIET